MSISDQTSSAAEASASTLVDTPKARKFLFDCVFDLDLAEKQKAPPLIFSQDDLDAACEQAFAQGKTEGRAEAEAAAKASLASRQNDLLDRIVQRMTALANESVAVWQDQLDQMQAIALVIARKIMPRYVDRFGIGEIEGILASALSEMGREPRLVVRVSEGDFNAVNDLIQSLTTRAAFPGKVVLLAEPGMESSDCRVEWADGGVERDLKTLWSAIDKIIESPPGLSALLEDKVKTELRSDDVEASASPLAQDPLEEEPLAQEENVLEPPSFDQAQNDQSQAELAPSDRTGPLPDEQTDPSKDSLQGDSV